jgi:hypothetical protein
LSRKRVRERWSHTKGETETEAQRETKREAQREERENEMKPEGEKETIFNFLPLFPELGIHTVPVHLEVTSLPRAGPSP